MPLESDGYHLFIDLSSRTYEVFEVHFFPVEPYYWTNKIWIDNMSNFLLSANDSFADLYATKQKG